MISNKFGITLLIIKARCNFVPNFPTFQHALKSNIKNKYFRVLYQK